MKCVDCRWFNKEDEFCMKDGGSVFGATIDDECEYADNMTVFDRITVSPEVLAETLVYEIKQLFTISGASRENPGGYEVKTKWFSTIVDGDFNSESEAIAATAARLKEVEK